MNFEELFDFESSKMLELVTGLQLAGKAVYLETLSEELKVDKKTVIRYVKKLQNLFEDYALTDELAVIYCSRKRVYLKKESEFVLEKFFVRFFAHIPELYFLKHVIQAKGVCTKAIAEQLLISESNLRKRIKKVKDRLSSVHVEFKHGTYELVGEEEQIRIFIYHYYWFVYRGTTNQFLPVNKEHVRVLVHLMLTVFRLKINKIQEKSLKRMIEIALFRHQENHKMNHKCYWKQYIQENTYFSIYLKQITDDCLFTLLDINEYTYLYLLIQAKFLPYFSLEAQTYMIQEHYKKRTHCYEHTLFTTTKFKQIFYEQKFVFSKEAIVSLLGFHLYYELFRSVEWMKRSQKNVELEKRYPKFIAKLKRGISELVREGAVQQRIPKHVLVDRYFVILSSLLSPVYVEQKIVICLMTDLSIEQEIALGKTIIDYFHNKYNITITYARTTTSMLYVDIILTTVIYQPIGEKYIEKILTIDSSVLPVCFEQIEKKIHQAR